MRIILSQQCVSFTGSLNRGYGYAVRKSKFGYYGCRNARGYVPPDGHLRFIFACAQLAKDGLHLADIEVPGEELNQAIKEAGITPFMFARKHETLNASSVLHFKRINKL